jgi:hypothetical protein
MDLIGIAITESSVLLTHIGFLKKKQIRIGGRIRKSPPFRLIRMEDTVNASKRRPGSRRIWKAGRITYEEGPLNTTFAHYEPLPLRRVITPQKSLLKEIQGRSRSFFFSFWRLFVSARGKNSWYTLFLSSRSVCR